MSNFSLTNNIRFYIIRSAAGLNYGSNYRDALDPRKAKKLSDVIGAAGVNLNDFAAFFGMDFEYEIIDRSAVVNNLQDIYFVDRRLLNLPPHLLIK